MDFEKARVLVQECGANYKEIAKKIRREYMTPQNYESEFEKALLTFKFQRVYCPKK